MAGFLKMFENDRKGTFKKEKIKDEHFDVARTRKWAEYGSDEEIRWLHSLDTFSDLIFFIRYRLNPPYYNCSRLGFSIRNEFLKR